MILLADISGSHFNIISDRGLFSNPDIWPSLWRRHSRAENKIQTVALQKLTLLLQHSQILEMVFRFLSLWRPEWLSPHICGGYFAAGEDPLDTANPDLWLAAIKKTRFTSASCVCSMNSCRDNLFTDLWVFLLWPGDKNGLNVSPPWRVNVSSQRRLTALSNKT